MDSANAFPLKIRGKRAGSKMCIPDEKQERGVSAFTQTRLDNFSLTDLFMDSCTVHS